MPRADAPARPTHAPRRILTHATTVALTARRRKVLRRTTLWRLGHAPGGGRPARRRCRARCSGVRERGSLWTKCCARDVVARVEAVEVELHLLEFLGAVGARAASRASSAARRARLAASRAAKSGSAASACGARARPRRRNAAGVGAEVGVDEAQRRAPRPRPPAGGCRVIAARLRRRRRGAAAGRSSTPSRRGCPCSCSAG